MPVDLIKDGKAHGEVAQMMHDRGQLNANVMRPYLKEDGGVYVTIYKGGDPKLGSSYKEVQFGRNQLEIHSTLRRDEWKQLDDVVLKVQRERLGAIDDLKSAGLTFDLGNGMETTVLEWHDVSDPGEAEMTMDGIHRGNNDRPDYKYNYLPIPIIHFDYEINARELAISRKMGNGLDTTMVEAAARRCMEKSENNLITASSYSYGEADQRGRNSAYSYLTHPDRLLYSLGTAWDDLDYDSAGGAAGETIINQVSAMKQLLIDAKRYGPYRLYVPTNFETKLDLDYSKGTSGSNSGITIRERILKIANITAIKVLDRLPADNVLLVQMTSDTVRLVRGMGITNVEWKVEANMLSHFKVMMIEVPQIRTDYNGSCGIVHASV